MPLNLARYLVTCATIILVVDSCSKKDDAPPTAPDHVNLPPYITATTPGSNDPDVSVNTTIAVTFSKPMDPATINDSTFTIDPEVAGTIVCTDRTVTFTPDDLLDFDQEYTVTVSSSVEDAQGIAMTDAYVWSFATITAPSVVSTSPENGATQWPVDSHIRATFSRAMDSSTINASTFTVSNGVTGTVSYRFNAAVYIPETELDISTTYTATLSDNIKDTAGNPLAQDFIWTFTTADIPEWERTFGGEETEDAYAVLPCEHGGGVLFGVSTSWERNGDVYIAEIGSKGDQRWYSTIGGQGLDAAWSATACPDGGYYAAGATTTYGAGGRDAYLMKVDAVGNLLWHTWYGGARSDEAFDVITDHDGNLLIAGISRSYEDGDGDIMLIKTDPSGQEMWMRTYGGPNIDIGSAVVAARDGGYLVVGNSKSFGDGSWDVLILRTDDTGQLIWQTSVATPGWEVGFSAVSTDDGTYIVVGQTDYFGEEDPDLYWLKIDDSGNVLWEVAYGNQNYECAIAIERTLDGHYLVSGWTTNPPNYLLDGYMGLISGHGDVLWDRTFGGMYTEEYFNCGVPTTDGALIAVGGGMSYLPNRYDFDAYAVKVSNPSILNGPTLNLPTTLGHRDLGGVMETPRTPLLRIDHPLQRIAKTSRP